MKPLNLRNLFLTLFVCIFSLSASAQGPWTQRATMPGNARHRAFTFSIGQRGYFGCGWNGVTMYNDFWEYDPASDSWSQKTNYPGGPRLSAFGFSSGNKGYAGTGLDANLYAMSDFYEYNPATNTWASKAPFIGTPVFGASAVEWNNTGLVMFGDDWNLAYYKHNEIYSYNISTNTWSYVTAFPGDGRRDLIAFNINNKIYFGTGNDNSYTELNDWWEWNPATGAMIPKATFIGTPRSQAVGFAINGKGYLGTGGVGDERDFFEYNPATNSWQGINEFPGSGRENSMSFVIGTRAYVIAGTSGINYHDTWEFNPGMVTGINENDAQVVVKTWPNPAIENVNVELTLTNCQKIHYQIYSCNGQIADEGDLTGVGNTFQIPVNQLAKGTYSMVLENEGNRWTTTFVH